MPLDTVTSPVYCPVTIHAVSKNLLERLQQVGDTALLHEIMGNGAEANSTIAS